MVRWIRGLDESGSQRAEVQTDRVRKLITQLHGSRLSWLSLFALFALFRGSPCVRVQLPTTVQLPSAVASFASIV